MLKLWLYAYLICDGNTRSITEELLSLDTILIGSVLIPITSFMCCCAPEDGMWYFEKRDRFEMRLRQLMYEIAKQLEILFADQKSTADFESMMKELESVADEARNVSGDKDWKFYSALKQCQYDYLDVLSEYVPKLLANEEFFKSTFK